MKNKTSRVPKITLPSPGLWANFWSRESPVPRTRLWIVSSRDIVQLLREEVQELVHLGAPYMQIDAPHYGLMLDAKTRRFYEKQGWSLDQWLTRSIELDNAIIAGVPGVHFRAPSLTRQSGRPVISAEGGYESPRVVGLFQRLKAQQLLLEYDDDRAGTFAATQGHPRSQIHRAGLMTA